MSQAKKGNVIKLPSGRKYVAAKDHELPKDASVVCESPHDDGDFSYCCDSNYCRCIQ